MAASIWPMRFCCALYICSWRITANCLLTAYGVSARPHGYLTTVKLGNPIYDLVEQVAVVGDDDDRAGIAAHQLFQRFLARHIEVVVRLVEQQQIGSPDQQPGEPASLACPPLRVASGWSNVSSHQAQVAEGRSHPVLEGGPPAAS